MEEGTVLTLGGLSGLRPSPEGYTCSSESPTLHVRQQLQAGHQSADRGHRSCRDKRAEGLVEAVPVDQCVEPDPPRPSMEIRTPASIRTSVN